MNVEEALECVRAAALCGVESCAYLHRIPWLAARLELPGVRDESIGSER